MKWKHIATEKRKRRTSVLLSLCFLIQAFARTEVFYCDALERNEKAIQVESYSCKNGVNTRIQSKKNVKIREIKENELYAESAVLMDGDSGRVLYSKNGYDERAMASTTKVMTCILTLEQGELDQYVKATENAAKQPEVRLGVKEGDEILLRDLLYSMMLESHNDSAVMIAEHIGGSVEGFADMMNEKAKEIGCENTYFITPNGLDEENEGGKHHTTAENLARIFKYCVVDSPEREMFLDITRKSAYQFTNKTGEKHYSCINHNALLNMMDGALSGKTGFTGDAGYCYVGAVESQGRTFIVSLLACGWPNNKGYKWKDTRKLISYGMENFHYRNVYEDYKYPVVEVKKGIPDDGKWKGKSTVLVKPQMRDGVSKENNEDRNQKIQIFKLLRDDEKVKVVQNTVETLEAPVKKGDDVGQLEVFVGKERMCSYPLITDNEVKKRTINWAIRKMLKNIK